MIASNSNFSAFIIKCSMMWTRICFSKTYQRVKINKIHDENEKYLLI